MYPYSDLPPNENPNFQGAYPPPPYQNPNQYYRPMPPFYSHFHPVLRIIGLVFLTMFVMALLFGHHGFFWPLIFIGAIFFFAGPRRYRGYNRPYGRHFYRYHRHNPAAYYYPTQEQPYYYNPSQPPQGQYQAGPNNWPTPGNSPKSDDIL